MRALLALVLLLVLAVPASAHVTVLPDVARPGDSLELTFRAQNERDDAATTKLEVFVPQGVPVAAVPREGWDAARTGDSIVWTPKAAGDAIPPGRTADFKVKVGPLPQSDRVVFKALQTYADGQVVRWIQDSGKDDERPAAILNLSGAGTSKNGGSAALIIAVIAVPLIVLALLGWRVTRRRR